jgi:FkbH-like protein
MENIRLVIWDLDETFWRGTLTEGGISEYLLDHHNIVVELARRGIISSICSKNSYKEIETVLVDRGIWEYFVFASVDWTPKASRISQIISKFQLRPSTVLFIDDNPLNRAEASHLIPGLQVADVDILPGILNDPRFVGKADDKLTRLKQYRLLETRAKDMPVSGGDNEDFLRASEIQVEILQDIEENIDRAIELINRTNQLNFTKKRLPEHSLEDARRTLREALLPFYAWCGLVHVKDKYGDYGIVGFFLGHAFKGRRTLVHFCFSCRTLGMGVERWVYDYLGRPQLKVVGDVLTDLSDDKIVNWINQPASRDGDVLREHISTMQVFLRGGCDLDAILHYGSAQKVKVSGETNVGWSGLFLRHDYSSNLVLSGSEDPSITAFIADLGMTSAFETTFFTPTPGRTATVLSFWADVSLQGFRHRATGALIGITPLKIDFQRVDRALRAAPDTELEAVFQAADIEREVWPFLDNLLRVIARECDPAGLVEEETYKRSLHLIFERAQIDTSIILILPPSHVRGMDQVLRLNDRAVEIRNWTKEVAAKNGHVHLVDSDACIDKDEEILAHNHFDRRVYYRIYKEIEEILSQLNERRDSVRFEPIEADFMPAQF